MKDLSRQYLFDYLIEEFRGFSEVRIRIPPQIPQTSEELDGVSLKTETREYFFPTEWIENLQMDEVEKEVRRIKEVLENR